MNTLRSDIRSKFLELFHSEPLLIRAPGRINMIGEHTDYNDGFVMPAAIDKEAVFAIAPAGDNHSVLHAYMYGEQFEFDMTNPQKVDEPRWANYLLGILFQFVRDGYPVKPFKCVFGGDVPLGAGLSSSAAIECGFAFALNELFQLNVPKQKLLLMAQWAEHNFAGVKCGIMDQFASMMGKEGHVIVLDCRSLEYRYAPIDLSDYTIVLCDSKVKHSLVDSEYNQRRKECEQGVGILRKHYPQVSSLRDVTPEMVANHRPELPAKVYQRCTYVTEEIRRVQLAVADLEKGDLKSFGEKMYETHEGLSVKYEVSCPELDFLVAEARNSGWVAGSRMMGGGFGGCTINLVQKDKVPSFVKTIKDAYFARFGIHAEEYLVAIRDGTGIV